MDLYTFSLLLGGAGLAAMSLYRVGHRHGHQHHGARHHAGHGHGAARFALLLLSPRILFSILLGVGLTGLLAGRLVGGVLLFAIALTGGVLFEHLAISPLWNFLLRFASQPASTLEQCVQDEAVAVTAFDARGHGMIALELDGQVAHVLATLQPEDQRAGIQVRRGDRVRIEDVDGRLNRCTVSVP